MCVSLLACVGDWCRQTRHESTERDPQETTQTKTKAWLQALFRGRAGAPFVQCGGIVDIEEVVAYDEVGWLNR